MIKCIHIVWFCLLATAVVSCKDDEGEVSAGIVGKWQGDYSDIKVSYGGITLHEETDDEFNVVLEFKDDGTATFTRDGNTTTGTYSLNGRKLTTNLDFQVQGVDLSTVTFDVMELTSTKLRLHLEQDQEVEVPDLGMVTTTINAKLSFDRL